MTKLRVLFVNHSGVFSGASRSLYELLRALPADSVEACVVAPKGAMTDVLARRGIQCVVAEAMSQFDNTRYGYYRGFRWLVLVRELAAARVTCSTIARAGREFPDFDLVHVNESVMLLAIVIAARYYSKPIVVHVRALQRTGNDWRSRMFAAILRRYVSAVIAIDETVRRTVPDLGPVPVEVIHNSLKVSEQPASARGATCGQAKEIVVAMIGNLLRSKGCFEFLEAAALCKRDAVPARFVFVGAGVSPPPGLRRRLLRMLGLDHWIEQQLRDSVAQRGLDDVVEFRSFTSDLNAVYQSIDVLCFPSHLDAPGRPVFEAAYFAVPSIVAISQPTPDTFIDGETGINIEAGSPEQIARALRYLAEHPTERQRMGHKARELALRNFDASKNAGMVLDLYRRVLSKQVSARG